MIHAGFIEIPVLDLDRAVKFYQDVFGLATVTPYVDDVRRVAVLFSEEDSQIPGISLNQTANFEPTAKGQLVYYNASEDLAVYTERVIAAGGKVIAPKESMGGAGDFIIFGDTEGNAFAFYSEMAPETDAEAAA